MDNTTEKILASGNTVIEALAKATPEAMSQWAKVQVVNCIGFLVIGLIFLGVAIYLLSLLRKVKPDKYSDGGFEPVHKEEVKVIIIIGLIITTFTGGMMVICNVFDAFSYLNYPLGSFLFKFVH